MEQDKNIHTDKDNTTDQYLSSRSLYYPQYLEIVKFNLESFLPEYDVSILTKQAHLTQKGQIGCFSIVVTCPNVFKSRFQILTEAFLDENTLSFYVRHMATINHAQLRLKNKDTVSLSLNFCNKINAFFEYFRLILNPVSGKTYFQTRSFINQSSLCHLKRNIPKQDCYYTQVIVNSVKKAERYLDLLLFLSGQIQLDQLLQNQNIRMQFPFLSQSQRILQEMETKLFYVSFLDLDQDCNQQLVQNMQYQSLFNFEFETASYQENPPSQQNNRIKFRDKKLSSAKEKIVNNSLQYFTKNAQNIIKIFSNRSPQQNVNFAHAANSFQKTNTYSDTTSKENQTRSSILNQRILSYIQIVQQQNEPNIQSEKKKTWEPVSEGGFGIIQLGTINFRDLSSSYSDPQTGFFCTVKRQVIRKRDKDPKRVKIMRQRKILQRLRFFTHSNIMKFYISFQNAHQQCIFSEYTPNMSLDVYLVKNQLSVNLDRRISLLIQAIQGLTFLHSNKIVHLDVKPGNMLISRQLRLLISDFGQAFVIGQDNPVTHNHAYTVPYCAPQIFLTKTQITQKADIYAIGVTILKIVLGTHLFQTFIKRNFVKRLCRGQILGFESGQKFKNSCLFRILRIISFVAYKAVSQQSLLRPQLSWVSQILNECRHFILVLFY